MKHVKFHLFLMEIGPSFASKTMKMLQRGSIFHDFATSASRTLPTCFWHRFFIIFSTILAPKSLPKCFRKPAPKNDRIWDRFLMDFGPNLASQWLQNRCKVDQKTMPSSTDFWRQHGFKLASKREQTSIKNRCQHRSENRCISRSIFDAILVGFGRENESKLAPTSIENRSP